MLPKGPSACPEKLSKKKTRALASLGDERERTMRPGVAVAITRDALRRMHPCEALGVLLKECRECHLVETALLFQGGDGAWSEDRGAAEMQPGGGNLHGG